MRRLRPRDGAFGGGAVIGVEAGFARLAAAPRVGTGGLARLRGSGAAVFGIGAAGGRIAELAAGVFGRVVLLDRGRVEPENLVVQCFAESEIGKPKAAARAVTLAARNPFCAIEAVNADIRDLGFGALGEIAVVFMAFDSRSARVVSNDLALARSWPMVDCAVDGSGRSLIGRVSAYAPGGACYVCCRDSAELAEIAREGGAACPAWSWDRSGENGPPTLSLPAVGAAAAAIAVAWAIRLVLEGPSGVADRELLLDLDRNVFSVHELRRNQRCLADHRALSFVPANRGTVSQTFDEAAELAGEPVTLTVRRRGVACAIRCPACLQERRPYRLLDAITPAEGRCACGGVMVPVAGRVVDRFDRSLAAPFLGRAWDELGLPAADVVVADGPRGEIGLCLT